MAKTKKFFILIPKDPSAANAQKEQFKVYQLDGQTFRVAIGVSCEVPEWLAKRAKEVGDVDDYTEIDA